MDTEDFDEMLRVSNAKAIANIDLEIMQAEHEVKIATMKINHLKQLKRNYEYN